MKKLSLRNGKAIDNWKMNIFDLVGNTMLNWLSHPNQCAPLYLSWPVKASQASVTAALARGKKGQNFTLREMKAHETLCARCRYIAEWNCVQQRWCPAISKTTMPHHYNRLMQQRWCPAISTLPSHIHSHCTRTYIPKGVHPDPTCVPTARAYGPFAYGLLPTTHY